MIERCIETQGDKNKTKCKILCETSKLKSQDISRLNNLLKYEKESSLKYVFKSFDKDKTDYIGEMERIMNAFLNPHKRPRKDAVLTVCVEVSSTADFFMELDESQERQFFQLCFDFLSESFGSQNVVLATVRNYVCGESPKLMFYFVPLTDNGRLTAKEILNRNALLYLQDLLPLKLQENGFEIHRGTHKSNFEFSKENWVERNPNIANLDPDELIKNRERKYKFEKDNSYKNDNELLERCLYLESEIKKLEYKNKHLELQIKELELVKNSKVSCESEVEPTPKKSLLSIFKKLFSFLLLK